jgi:hypothetical protein
VGREDVPDAELLGELRETLANGASVRRDGVVCVSRNGGDRPPAGQLLAALATGACLTLVD